MNYPLIIGICGATVILIAFVLNELHRLHRDSLTYDLLNLIGGLLLCTYALMIWSVPFLVLNGVWALVSLRDVVIDLTRSKKITPKA